MAYSVALESTLPADWGHVVQLLVFGIRGAVSNACEEGAEEARTTHKYKDRTGNLTRSIKDRIIHIDALGAEGEIVAEAKYASFVNDGTKPHVIRPRRANVLAWEGDGGQGDWHYAKVVHHPGTPPLSVFGNALVRVEHVLSRDIEAATEKAQAALP